MNTEELIKKSESAIFYLDTPEAYRLLKEWSNIFNLKNVQNLSYGQQKLQTLINNLKVVAFPHLSDEEAGEILKNHLLDFFELEASLETALTEKLFNVPYSVRGQLREKLEQAVASNTQTIGSLTVGQWIKLFDETFPKSARDASAIIQFFSTSPQVRSLNISDMNKLKEILHVYDYLLIYTLPATGDDLVAMENAFVKEIAEEKNIPGTALNQNRNIPFGEYSTPQNNIASLQNIAIQDAIHSHPKLGEQAITSVSLKLRNFPQPARPSVKNWLYDYASHLGQGPHDSMQRMNYLFASENGKKLSSQDRDKLGILLKSLDENTPLAVDTQNQEIIFESAPRFETAGANPMRPSAPAPSRIEFKRDIPEKRIPRSSVEPPAMPYQSAPAPQEEMPVEKEVHSFTKPYHPINAPPTTAAAPAPPPTPIQNFPKAKQSIPEPRVQAPSPPLPKIDHSYRPSIAPAQRPIDPRPVQQVRPLQNTAEAQPPDMKFSNPYPTPGEHKDQPEMAGTAPVKFKGFSDGSPAPSLQQADTSHKNIYRPHFDMDVDGDKPEPKIEGNVVDLRGRE